MLVALCGHSPALADEPTSAEAYYMVIYGAQDQQPNPLTSHCFATFIKVTRHAEGSTEPRIELKHINWFTKLGHETGVPHGLLVDGQLERPEPGENRDTASALRGAAKHKLTVYRYGPYEIDKFLYQRAVRQIDRLEGRVAGARILYKQLDFGFREEAKIIASNCIHAVSDVIREPAPLTTGLTFGREAAHLNLKHLRRWMKDPTTVHTSLWKRIWSELWSSSSAPEVSLVECTLAGENLPHTTSPSESPGKPVPGAEVSQTSH